MSRELSSDQIRILTQGTFEEKVRLARTMTGQEKIRAGFQLFEIECRHERAALRTEFPSAPEPLIEKFLRDRINERRDLPWIDLPMIVDSTL